MYILYKRINQTKPAIGVTGVTCKIYLHCHVFILGSFRADLFCVLMHCYKIVLDKCKTSQGHNY